MLPKSLTDSKHIKADGKYVVCAPRTRSRQHTIEQLMGKGFTNYRYYKTKGYYEAQLLVAQQELGKRDVIAVQIQGQDIIDYMDPSITEVALYPADEWRAYQDAMFSDEVVGQADREYDQSWELECVKDSWQKGLIQHNRRLPRDMAMKLKSQRDMRVYRACRQWFDAQQEAA